MISELANNVFDQSIKDYHQFDNIDQSAKNPFDDNSLANLFYLKNWVDTAQWHMEDVVRNPNITPVSGLTWKRRIDTQNQVRTDMVEFIDSYFLNLYKNIRPNAAAKINTESPAWAIDRLSILALKIYHMQEEVKRTDASLSHQQQCQIKLDILLAQRTDLSNSIDELISDIEAGNKYMKVYKQMKMYNDPSLNPILYKK